MEEYSISYLFDKTKHLPYYVGVFEDTQDPHIKWPHRHSFFSLVWFTEGSGSYVIDFQEYAIQSNRIFLLSPQQIHNWDYSDDAKGYFLMIEADSIVGINTDIIVPYVDMPNHQFLLRNIFTYLVEEYCNSDNLSQDIIKSGITFLYSIIYREIKQQGLPVYSASPIMDKLHQLLATCKNFTTAYHYANIIHTSIKELDRACKLATGVSVKQFILNQKDIEAKRLLLYSQYNINEIAYRLGYEDTSYFSRRFRKKNECNPTEFREKYRRKTQM